MALIDKITSETRVRPDCMGFWFVFSVTSGFWGRPATSKGRIMWVYCLGVGRTQLPGLVEAIVLNLSLSLTHTHIAAAVKQFSASFFLPNSFHINNQTVTGEVVNHSGWYSLNNAVRWCYITLLPTLMKAKLENSHLSNYTQPLRDDLSRRTVTPVPMSSPCVSLILWPWPFTLTNEPSGEPFGGLDLTTFLFMGQCDLWEVTERNSLPTNPSSF